MNANDHLLRLSAEAQGIFTDYRDKVEIRLRPGGELSEIADWGNRLPGTVVRAAGMLHMLVHSQGESRPWEVTISSQTMQAAIRIGEYYKAHALVAFGIMGLDGKLNRARKVWTSIEQLGKADFKESDLWQLVRRQFAEPAALREILRLLESMNYIREIGPIEPLKKKGRKGSPSYEINPLARTLNTVCTLKPGNPPSVGSKNVQNVRVGRIQEVADGEVAGEGHCASPRS